MKTTALIAALLTAATLAIAAVPPIVYELESDFQQVQELPDQDFVQGAGVSLRYRIKSQGRWLSLAGLGARWDGRSSSTSTQALQAAASVVTNVTPNYFQITLDSTETGSAVTNWVYSLIVTDGGIDYPIGAGDLDIAASTWTGAAAILSNVTAAAYTDAAVATHAAIAATTNSLGHIIVGSGLSVDGDGVLSNPQSVPAWGDVTGKPFTNLVDLTTANLTGIDFGVYATTTTVGAIDVRLTTAEGEIDDLQGATNSLNTRVGTAESDILSLEGATNSLNTRIGTAEGDITTLESATNSLNSSVASLNSATNALDGRVTTLEGQTNGYVEVGDTNGWTVTTHTPYVLTNDTRTVALGGALSTTSTLGVTGAATVGSLSSEGNVTINGVAAFGGTNSNYLNTASSSIYRTSTGGTSYPFQAFDHLVIQSRGTSARDIILAGGVFPSVLPHVVVQGSTGNIGIGTNAPASGQRLHVIGNARIDGNILASGSISGASDYVASNGASLTNTAAVAAGAVQTNDSRTVALTGLLSTTENIGSGSSSSSGSTAGLISGVRGSSASEFGLYSFQPNHDQNRIEWTVRNVQGGTNSQSRIDIYPDDRVDWDGLDFEDIGDTVALSYALTGNRLAIPAATDIGTNATYAISYADGAYQVFGFSSTNDITLTLTGPGTGYRAYSEVTFTNYTYRAVTWPTNNATWINTAPTGAWARVAIDWADMNGTVEAALINTTPTGE